MTSPFVFYFDPDTDTDPDSVYQNKSRHKVC